jgi:hypothetical protein
MKKPRTLTLSEWLTANSLTASRFAALLTARRGAACSREVVRQWLDGTIRPSKTWAPHVIAVTRGEVTPDSWYVDEIQKARRA